MSKGNPFFNIIPNYVICQNSRWICSRKSAASNTNVYIDFSSHCNFRASFCSTFILAHNLRTTQTKDFAVRKNSLLPITPDVASPLQKKAPPDLQRPSRIEPGISGNPSFPRVSPHSSLPFDYQIRMSPYLKAYFVIHEICNRNCLETLDFLKSRKVNQKIYIVRQ